MVWVFDLGRNTYINTCTHTHINIQWKQVKKATCVERGEQQPKP